MQKKWKEDPWPLLLTHANRVYQIFCAEFQTASQLLIFFLPPKVKLRKRGTTRPTFMHFFFVRKRVWGQYSVLLCWLLLLPISIKEREGLLDLELRAESFVVAAAVVAPVGESGYS